MIAILSQIRDRHGIAPTFQRRRCYLFHKNEAHLARATEM